MVLFSRFAMGVYYPPPHLCGAGDIGLAGVRESVRPCVRVSVRLCVRHRLDLRDGLTDFLDIWHGIGTRCELDARLLNFSVSSKMAARRPFWKISKNSKDGHQLGT